MKKRKIPLLLKITAGIFGAIVLFFVVLYLLPPQSPISISEQMLDISIPYQSKLIYCDDKREFSDGKDPLSGYVITKIEIPKKNAENFYKQLKKKQSTSKTIWQPYGAEPLQLESLKQGIKKYDPENNFLEQIPFESFTEENTLYYYDHNLFDDYFAVYNQEETLLYCVFLWN